MKIGVGISGGVDSAVTASRLLAQEHEVIGFTMALCPSSHTDETIGKAAQVAKKLGIEHVVLDFTASFRQEILDYFVGEYAIGRTPSPCVRCNRRIKFGIMQQAILDHGCDCMATGHYARIKRQDDRLQLLRGLDPVKDQSYFLAQLTQEQLAKACFPLGELQKSEVKEQGATLGLVPKSQSESQDLCFLPDGDFMAGELLLMADGDRVGLHVKPDDIPWAAAQPKAATLPDGVLERARVLPELLAVLVDKPARLHEVWTCL